MNKVFKVIWSEARNAYVVVSEIAKNHGSKSSSTKKLLAMLIATGVMTCASFDVLAAQPAAEETAAQQYVALKAADFPATGPRRFNKDTWGSLGSYEKAKAEWNDQKKGSKYIGDYTYTYDRTNKYWVRDGYVLTVDEKGGKYTPLSANKIHADVAYTKDGVAEGILQSVTSTVAHNGVVTHSGDSLQKITAGSYAGVSHGGGTKVAGSWKYIIQDSSWKSSGAEHENDYVDLKGDKMPKGFKTIDSGLEWDEAKQTYTYQGKAVDYRNMYVIGGKLGVFTNADGKEVYTGTVYGKNNEILMTVKDNGKFYSYWAASVTDPSATMETYPVSKYNSDLAVIDQNIKDLNKDIINEVTLDTSKANSATIGLLRNGGRAVDGAITVTSGGGTGGSGAAHDTSVKISNGTTEQTFATGSKVEAIGTKDATTGIKINGQDYTIANGWNLTTAHGGTTTTVKPGDTVDFSPEDTNLTVTNEGTNVKIGLNQDLHLTSATFGDTTINANGLTIGHGTAGLEFSQNRVSVGGQQIHDVADGKDNTDAVNVGQLKQVADAATSNDKRLVQNPNDSDGSYQVRENGDVTLRVEDSNKNGYNVTIKDVASKAELDKVKTDVGNVDGFHDEIKNKDTNGKPTHTSVVDAVNNLDTKVNTIQSDVTKATEEAKKHSSVSTGNGLDLDVTDNNGQKDYKVSLKDDFTLGGKDGHTGSIEFKGSEGNITASGTLTANAVSVGNTSISDTRLQIGNKTSLTEDALTIGGNTYITDKGIDANQQKISNVADGDISKDSKDAVNGSQLYATNEAIANNYNNITNLNGRISNLDNRVNKVGAGAAALAALHPLDFDPDAKWDFAAGYGNYRGANAAAVGAYYRPNEDTMFSVGGTFGNGENMVNAGVSFKLGSGSSHVSTSRVAMAKEIKELRGELEAMKSAMLDANAGKKIDTSKLQLFPDVPQNHWAYEYVAQLAGNGMIEGYPDGNFAGDRPMTRYEFAAILYRAMTKGAVLSDKILSEFSHELEYFTVDTIAKDKAGNPTIQRVRTVKENKNK